LDPYHQKTHRNTRFCNARPFFGQLPELIGKLTPYGMQGKIRHRAHVLNGLESSIDGLNLLLTGGNKGKLIVKL
jgi:NADPH-dependent curcumin reductase CurA